MPKPIAHTLPSVVGLLLLVPALSSCATDQDLDTGSPLDEQSLPSQPDGKADGAFCGAESCVPQLCGYDCATSDAQCTRSCAASDTRANAFVAGTIGGTESSTFDSRTNPYVPVVSADNVLVYGCDVWNFGDRQGFAVQFQELIHSPLEVDPNDPERTARDFEVYVPRFTGPGSYRGQARFAARSDGTRYRSEDACTVDIAADADRGLTGTYDCTIPSDSGAATTSDMATVQGSFGCGQNAMSPIFSRWVH